MKQLFPAARVKRSQSMPLHGAAESAAARYDATEERDEVRELHVLLSDEEEGAAPGAARPRALTTPRTSPSSPQHGVPARSEPAVTATSSHATVTAAISRTKHDAAKGMTERTKETEDVVEGLPERMWSSRQTNRITSNKSASSSDYSPASTPLTDEDVVDRSTVRVETRTSELVVHSTTRDESDGEIVCDKCRARVRNNKSFSRAMCECDDSSDSASGRKESTRVEQPQEIIGRNSEFSESLSKAKNQENVNAETGEAVRHKSGPRNEARCAQDGDRDTRNANRGPELANETSEAVAKKSGLSVNSEPSTAKREGFYLPENQDSSDEHQNSQSTEDVQIGPADTKNNRIEKVLEEFVIVEADAAEIEHGRLSEGAVAAEAEPDEPGLTRMSAGLLQLLSGVVVSLPPRAVPAVLGVILKPDLLLVLARHPDAEVRTNAVKVQLLFKM